MAAGTVHRMRLGLIRRSPVFAAGGLGLGGAVYAGTAATTWLHFGRERTREPDLLLDGFMPAYDLEERHAACIDAPAEATWRAAQHIDFNDSALARTLFFVRTLPTRLRGHAAEPEQQREGFLAQAESLGWRRLAEIPGRRLVMGAVTQPWKGEVVFRGLPPEEFAKFAEPGFVKILWTFSVEPRGAERSLFHTETRAVATDAEARRRFRRYWAFVAPGVKLIRLASLALVRRGAIAAAHPAAQRPMD